MKYEKRKRRFMLAVDAYTCCKIREESVTSLKAQHVMWRVTWRHLPRGHRGRSLSLFAENKYTARDWGLVIRSVIGSRGHQQQIATWTVLSGTRGPGKLMYLREGRPGG